MFYTIYKTTNLVNGKIYIGSHKTKDLDDGYLGSGKYLRRAIEKHGFENFKKEILFVFDNPEEMYAKEAELVNEDFLSEENTYNLKVGGFGGFDYINKNVDLKERNRKINSKRTYNEARGKTSKGFIKVVDRLKTEGVWFASSRFSGMQHTTESKRKISEAMKNNCVGQRNSQYGTRWIYSEDLCQSKKILKTEPVPEGWNEGRKIKFKD